MEVNVEHLLNAQHCLAIAAAFIAIVAACATLITSANNKAESLASRIREAAKEHRMIEDSARCRQLTEQLALFKSRFRGVQQAQRLLFSTIGIFIASLLIFICLGLYLLRSSLPPEVAVDIARTPLFWIGSCVSLGTLLMLVAIGLQFWEVGKSYATLSIETRDCTSAGDPGPSAYQQSDLAPVSAGKG